MKTKLIATLIAAGLSFSAHADYASTSKAFKVFDNITAQCESVADAKYAKDLPVSAGDKKATNEAFDTHMRAKFDCLDKAAFERDKLMIQPEMLNIMKALRGQNENAAEKTLAKYGATHGYRSVLKVDGQVVAKHDFGMTELSKIYNEPTSAPARLVPVVIGAESAIGYEEFTLKEGNRELRVYVPMDTYGTRGGRLSPLDRIQTNIERVEAVAINN